MPLPRLSALLLTTALAAVPGCGGDSGAPAAKPPASPPTGAATPSPRAGDPRAEPYEVTVRHVLYAYKGASRSKVGRTKEQARMLAESAIADLAKGRSFEEIVANTDDLQGDGTPNPKGGPPGQYTITRASGFAGPFVEAAYSTPVGQVAPQPVETEFGFHVIRRVK